MHIILGLLTVIVTILVLLNRLTDAGIDLGWLNPFAWHRRRKWRKQYEGNPVFSLEQPLEVAAMLATCVAKLDGEISKEDKSALLNLFQSEFGLSEKDASDLLMSSIYLFGDGEEAIKKPEKIIERSLPKFSEDQAASVVSLIKTIAELDATNTTEKNKFTSRVEQKFDSHFGTKGSWQ
ncbi:MAG: TerB family tellurite resistance protein [Pseudomonadota bacterium]